MTQVFQFDKVQTVSLKPKDWVRMKSGLYENDIAQVIQVIDPISKILVKLLPRISDTVSNNRAGKVIRPIPKLFNPTHFDKVEQRNHPYLGPCLQWNKQTFKDGFLIKQVSIRSLLTQNIVPSIEELKIFSLSSDEHTDLNTLVETLQETGLKKKKFVKGDKVKLVKGGLNGITGKIVSYSGNTVQVQVEVEGIDDILEFPEDYVIKDFLPGDMVRVVTGPNIGKHGLLVNIDGDTAVIYSDDGEFKASSQDLVSATEVTTESNVSNPYFNHGDLIKINNVSNSVCYVLEVHKYSLKVIDTRSEVKNVPIRDAAKWTNLKPNGIDAKRNPITKQDTVKIIAGPNKSRKGVIKNIFRNFVFLFNQDFVNSNGIFVEKSENVEIMGSELLVDGIDVTKGKVNLKKIPDEIKSLLGKTIKIIKGNWKGYFGTLRNVTDKNAYVELLSKNKTITIDLSAIQSIDDDPSARRSDFMATPRSSNVPKTPAYYPQSPSFAKSPSWNVTATRKIFY